MNIKHSGHSYPALDACDPADGPRFAAIARKLGRESCAVLRRACFEPFAMTRNGRELTWVDANAEGGRKRSRTVATKSLSLVINLGLVQAQKLADGLGLVSATELGRRVVHHVQAA